MDSTDEILLLVVASAAVFGLVATAAAFYKQRQWAIGTDRSLRLVVSEVRSLRAWLHIVEQRLQSSYFPFGAYSMSADNLLDVLNSVHRLRPGLVVELGCGLSTIETARVLAVAGKGHLISVEHNSAWIEIVRQRLEDAGLAESVTLVHAPLEPVRLGQRNYLWYQAERILQAIGSTPVDILVVDGPPGQTCSRARYPALPMLAGNLNRDAVVFLDDAERVDEGEIMAAWGQEFGFSCRISEGVHMLGVLNRGGRSGIERDS